MSYKSLWANVKNRKKYERRHNKVPVILKNKSERFFLNYVVKYFKKGGWKAHHHDTRNPKNAWIIGPGFVDLVFVKKVKRKGRILTVVLWAELKTERGYPSKEQIVWMNLLPKNRTFLWRPSDWGEIQQIKKEMGKSIR